MSKKGEKIANLSISILEPPSIQMTCATSDFRLESFSSNINDQNYLHLPPPNPKFSIKKENSCYTDIPMYAMAIATNKNTTAIRECSIFGNAFYESRDIGRFSSTTNGHNDFIIQPNEQVFIPFQIKVPHLISSVSSQTKVNRSRSSFNTEVGSNQKPPHPIKSIVINSFFNFRANENNQKMQVNTVEKINVHCSIFLSYKLSNPFADSKRNSLFQIMLTNNLPIVIRNVEVKPIESNHRSPIPIPNVKSTPLVDNSKRNMNRSIKLGESIEVNETVSNYISYSDPFNSMEIYFLLPFCTFCYFTEPVLVAQGVSQKLANIPVAKQLSQQTLINKQQNIPITETKKIPSTSVIENKPGTSQMAARNPFIPQGQTPQSPIPHPINLTFQASLNKLPKAVQTLRPFSIQIQIVNTTKSNPTNQGELNDTIISGSISIGESDSISLFGNNDLTFPSILPGRNHIISVNLIALKQGNFTFPKIVVKLNNFRNTEVDFETGVIAIGCNE